MLPPLRKALRREQLAAALAGAEAQAVADATTAAAATATGATVVVKPRRRRSLRHVAAPCLRGRLIIFVVASSSCYCQCQVPCKPAGAPLEFPSEKVVGKAETNALCGMILHCRGKDTDGV
ncbi:hypothetical protein J1605_007175 [Eschrichtius robustus]|uniref:40S ribosomal protein S6 n=1 Tax=Eschrichtius robustus TaxID=9764 RepID=A0AB34H2B5_ESCRO|nr:hypothetical protein J1605_007175 [Eschrichtius robustus]